MMNIKKYFEDILSPDNEKSSRKFITLIITGHFFLGSFILLFFAFYVILWSTQGKTDVELLKAFMEVMRYDFYIILSGFGFITSSDLVRVIISKGFDPKGYRRDRHFGNDDDFQGSNINIDNPDNNRNYD